jgi:hypothetical protein
VDLAGLIEKRVPVPPRLTLLAASFLTSVSLRMVPPLLAAKRAGPHAVPPRFPSECKAAIAVP